MKGPSSSPYDFVPKIADFGLYSRVRTAKAKASGPVGLDQSGSQRYSKHTVLLPTHWRQPDLLTLLPP